jgi:hypothetical protein
MKKSEFKRNFEQLAEDSEMEALAEMDDYLTQLKAIELPFITAEGKIVG